MSRPKCHASPAHPVRARPLCQRRRESTKRWWFRRVACVVLVRTPPRGGFIAIAVAMSSTGSCVSWLTRLVSRNSILHPASVLTWFGRAFRLRTRERGVFHVSGTYPPSRPQPQLSNRCQGAPGASLILRSAGILRPPAPVPALSLRWRNSGLEPVFFAPPFQLLHSCILR